MFQYAKDFFKGKIEQEKNLKEQKEFEKHQLARKLDTITEYSYLKAQIIDTRIEIGMIFAAMCLGGWAFLSMALTTEMIGLTIIFESAVGAIFLPKTILKLSKSKKEYKKFSKKEVNELKENEENMKELYHKLEKEMTSSQNSIDQYEKELEKISVVEEFNDSGAMNQPLYQADTKEEYDLLTKKQEKAIMPFEEFLNEKVNYENIHLEVSEVDSKPKYLVRK